MVRIPAWCTQLTVFANTSPLGKHDVGSLARNGRHNSHANRHTHSVTSHVQRPSQAWECSFCVSSIDIVLFHFLISIFFPSVTYRQRAFPLLRLSFHLWFQIAIGEGYLANARISRIQPCLVSCTFQHIIAAFLRCFLFACWAAWSGWQNAMRLRIYAW